MVETLDWHVAEHPDRQHLTVLQDESIVLATLTYGELAKAARSVAAGLLEADVAPGDRIALMLPTGTEFFIAFFGILYAGAVPVPIYPPMQLSKIEEYMRRQAGILRNAGARILITVPEGLQSAAMLRASCPQSMRCEASRACRRRAPGYPAADLARRRCDRADPVHIRQHWRSEGGGAEPRQLARQHPGHGPRHRGDIGRRVRELAPALSRHGSDRRLARIPLFCASFYVMSPLSFLARPQSWLWAMHRFRATISAAPNFAFELCATKIDDADLKGLNLSALRLLANGAEPISVNGLRQFTERYARFGFRPEAMAPVYGLAECAVALAMPPLGRPPIIDRVRRETLSRRARPRPRVPRKRTRSRSSDAGNPCLTTRSASSTISVARLPTAVRGDLEFRGPSATPGYFRSEAKTRALFHDGWLDSGDLAYIANADVFITGRTKDIIIRAGQGIYPHELEDAIGDIVGIRKGGVVVFGMPDPKTGTERMIIVAETDLADPAARESLGAEAQEAATDIVGAPADEIVFVAPGAVPKTSSGKIRPDCRKRALRGRAAHRTAAGAPLADAAAVACEPWAPALPAEPGTQGQALRGLVVDRIVGRLRELVGRQSCCCRAWNGVGRRCACSPRRRLPPWACLCRSVALIAFRVVGRSSCSITQATRTRSFSVRFYRTLRPTWPGSLPNSSSPAACCGDRVLCSSSVTTLAAALPILPWRQMPHAKDACS